MDNLVGQNLRGYELREMIGAGGFGAVYRAYQPAVEREVAIKIILPQYANQPDFVRRFEAEAHLVARLEHIHIVPLYDYWRDPDGAYLVMRWLRGGSLRDLLRRGRLDNDSVVTLFEQIASALSAAHRHNVAHRDLKPDNILLDESGNAYLADFGIAKELVGGSTLDEEEDTFSGSPAYISPEQITGDLVTPQTDIYALGIMLYEMFAGRHPYQDASTTGLLYKQLSDPLPTLLEDRPDLPPLMDVILSQATAKKADERYRDALDFSAEVRRALGEARQPSDAMDRTPAQGVVMVTGFQTTIAEVARPEVDNPYKGLRAFGEADANEFFGREALTEELLVRLSESNNPYARFLAVVGPSGSGKSSVVKAGVIPQLRRGKLLGSDRWFIVEMLPGSQPLQELEDALLSVAVNRPEGLIDGLRANEHGLVNALKRLLPQDDSQLFLFIDQFEELFTLVEDEAMRAHFLASLLIAATEADSRLRLVIALRADFYDRPLLYPTFGTLIRMRTEVVLPLLPDELERAIAQPAERSGVALEDKLVKAIIADVGEQPGALPLLQYALTELFERREDHMMTLQAYNESGGVLGALARRADEIYERLDDDERKAARQLFLRLVTLGEGTEDTRRRVMQVELASLGTNKATMQAVIKEFGQYRLLTFDRDPATRSPTAEVAHEALIRQWARLREWLTDSREDVRLQRRIAAEAAEWVKSGREVSFLASGARLQQLEEWAQHTDLALNQTEQAYLHASLERRAQLAAQEAERKAHEELLERRSRERLRALVGVLLVAAVIGFGLSIFALNQRQAANANADNAATAAQVAALNADEAQGLALASSSELALSNNNTEQALALALANHHFDIPLAQRALYDAAYAPGIRQQMIGHVGEVLSVAYSPDGKTALSGSADTRLFLWDLSTGKTLRQFSGHSDWVQSVAFSPDGKTALSGSADHSVILWDIATGAVIRRLDGHQDAVWSVAFSPDGKTALSGSADNSLILWDIASGGVIRRYSVQNDSLSGPVYSVAFTPDGHSAVVGLGDGNVILWDVGKGTLIRKFGSEGKQHTTLVRGVAVSPDGKWALSGSGDRTVILWEIATGNFIRQFSGHSDWVMSVAFSPDGSMALSGSEDNKIILWNLSTTSEVGTVLHRFEGHNGKVNSVAFSPDGRTILSGASDNNLILWDLNSGAQLAHLGGMGVPGGHTDWATAVKFTPDGKNALSASVDGTLILWDLATGKPIRQFTQPDVKPDETPALWSFVFSPNGKTVLAAADDTTILEWDLASGQFLRHFKGHDNWVNTLTFSPDGRTFLSASGDHTLILWDYASGSIIRRFGANGEGHTDAVTGVRFSPDGRTAISSSYDNTLILWDVETGTVIRRFKGHDDWVNTVALSRDGKQALSGSNDATMILWDVATGSQIRRFREHTSAVLDVAFSPDGKTALSASADNSVIRWNLETGDALERLEGHNKPVDSVAFSPDGHTALSASYDNSVIWWRLDSLNELIQWVYANRYVRDLTCAERDQFRLSPCDSAGQFPTRTPYLTTLPTATDTATPTPDRTRTTATPQPTVTLTLTPPPTATPTHVPPAAQIGSHWGEVIVGDRDAWTYTGHAGDVLTIGTAADKPANGVSPDEGKRRGLLDTILILRAPDGSIVAQSDDIADGITDSRIDQAALPVDGTYVIEIHSYGDSEGGGYTLSITMNGTVTPTPAS